MSTHPIHIFRVGKHTAMSGAEINFSESDLMRTAASYNPRLHRAPLVLGHPATDAPAYGSVQRLRTEGGQLFAESEVGDELTALVRAKKYFAVSASFYAPQQKQNPVPGTFYLRHVGFLGAQPPAVKGLISPSFAEGDALYFRKSLPLTILNANDIQAVDFAEDREGFHQAAQAAIRANPGLTYAQAASAVHQRFNEQAAFAESAASGSDRAAQHAQILQLQAQTPGLSYAEAASRHFGSRSSSAASSETTAAQSRTREEDFAEIQKLQATNPGMSFAAAASRYFAGRP